MAPIPIQILSDLHLETHPSYTYEIKQSAPYLALLGDIGHVGDDSFLAFLEKQLSRFWVVFFLLGNHEPCHSSWQAAKGRMTDFTNRMERLRSKSTVGRFVFLDRTRYDVNETVTVLGCTLFSKVMNEQAAAVDGRFVDFRDITGWTVGDHVDAHDGDVRWLNEEVTNIHREEPGRQIAVFTHHSPAVDERTVDPAFRGKPSEASSGFMTDLSGEECWKSPAVVFWAFGHTHTSCDFEDDLGKKVVANQKGYYNRPSPNFNMKKVLIVGKDASSTSMLG